MLTWLRCSIAAGCVVSVLGILGIQTGAAGRYVSDEVEPTLIAAIDGDRLVLRRRPDSDIVLTPVYPDGFSSSLGWIVFHRAGAGRATGLSVSQDRVWDLRFTRQADSPRSSARR